MFCLDRSTVKKCRPANRPWSTGPIVLILVFLLSMISIQGCQEKKKPSTKERMSDLIDLNMAMIEIYGMLNGDGDHNERTWETPVDNWIYGDITSDNSYKGTTAEDHPRALEIETYNWQPDNEYFNVRWNSLYKAIGKCNEVVHTITDKLGPEDPRGLQLAGEARFLRGHFYFQAKILWNHVPWLGENENANDLSNDMDIWPMIESDFQYAILQLPDSQRAPGRVTSWAAKAYLAKALMYQHKYQEAKPLLDDIIQNGPYSLETCYFDNFSKAAMKYNESVFNAEYIIESSRTETPVRQGEEGGELLEAGPKEYCAFHQPSQNLVNAFKTSSEGLPLFGTYNNSDVKNDEGIPSDKPFTPYRGNLDPRLDYTVGRRGIPFLDYGIHPGMDWIVDQAFAGPYSMKKYILSHADKNTAAMSSSWAEGADSKSYRVIRFAHILLWRAEVAVEENDLKYALELVNRIRYRAKTGCRLYGPDGRPATRYVIGLYKNFPDREYAQKAVEFETRLEFGMEGDRFFNLRRWGRLEPAIHDYLAKEQLKRTYLKGAVFTTGKNEYFPIPAEVLDRYPKMKQNPGY